MQQLIDLLVEHGFAITGALLLACFAAFLAWRNNRKNRYASACIKFRADVLNELSGLYPVPSEWPEPPTLIRKVLVDKFPPLQVAVHEFRFSLNPIWRPFFDIAWNKYLNGTGRKRGSAENYWQYVPSRGFETKIDGKTIEHNTTLTYKKDFEKNVRRLLSYAKEA